MAHRPQDVVRPEYVLGYVEQCLRTVRTNFNTCGSKNWTDTLVALDIGTLTRAIELIDEHRKAIDDVMIAPAALVEESHQLIRLPDLVQLVLDLKETEGGQ